MQQGRLFLSLLLVAGMLAYSTAAMSAEVKAKGVKPGVVEAIALNKSGTYCHLKFPAIEPSTLESKTPKLKSTASGDLVDFYGPCDHDPAGYDEVCRQKMQNAQRQWCD